jgi:hypothetical protein
MIMKHLRHGSDVGKQLEIAIAWLQRQPSLGRPVLGAPEKYLQHLESVYLKSVAIYLDNIKGKLMLEEDFSAPLQREGDFYIMERVIDSGRFDAAEIKQINLCQLWLQVHTVADMADESGLKVQDCFW